MDFIQLIMPFLGAAICVWAVAQFAGWARVAIPAWQAPDRNANRRKKNSLAEKKRRSGVQQENQPPADTWQGFRMFRVAKLKRETTDAMSVYLEPGDRKPLVGFKPGQHLTLKLQHDANSPPLVRCYSLSDSPQDSSYRITVKKVLPPAGRPEWPAGKASAYLNHQLQVGMQIPIKAPAGSFFLEPGDNPVILLAAGVGITPMMSMIEAAVAAGSRRSFVLFYGNLNGQSHIYQKRLADIASRHKNILVINCYSEPSEADQPNVDYQYRGWVSAELVAQVLPSRDFQFYMCGPPAFMESLYNGLVKWGVADSQIHFEAFGPATVKRVSQSRSDGAAKPQPSQVSVNFTGSDREARWNGEHDSLLECAEAHDVWIDSGCRAGSCGTCETKLIRGEVDYPGQNAVHCAPGKCLPCIAVPTSDVELEA